MNRLNATATPASHECAARRPPGYAAAAAMTRNPMLLALLASACGANARPAAPVPATPWPPPTPYPCPAATAAAAGSAAPAAPHHDDKPDLDVVHRIKD